MLPLQELFGQYFSRKNVVTISWSPLLCHQRAVGWRCSWKIRVIETSLLGGLPRSLYLWPPILNIHTYVAAPVSTVLTLHKLAICLQACLVWGCCHHQNSCSDNMLVRGVSHGCLNKETGHPKSIPTSAAWFMPQCCVPWNVFPFTFPSKKISA